jgi:hypothetical protein
VSIPDTWVTFYTGDMGNTFGPKGFSIGSSLNVIEKAQIIVGAPHIVG